MFQRSRSWSGFTQSTTFDKTIVKIQNAGQQRAAVERFRKDEEEAESPERVVKVANKEKLLY